MSAQNAPQSGEYRVNREHYRFHRGLAVDAALEAATLFLGHPGIGRSKTRCIAYHRVYSEEPPHPGYEREAQRLNVKRVVDHARATLIASYEEPEKRGRVQGLARRRLQLDAALAHCQAQGAMLIIAKLGHLVDSAPILSQLAASGVEFVALDKPHVNHRTIEALAIAAQRKEKARTEQRRAVWAALKARGYRPVNATPEAARRGTEAVRAQSRVFAAEVAPYMVAGRRNGWTLAKTAAVLNTLGITTRRGLKWNENYVHRELKRSMSLAPSETQIAAAAKLMETAAASTPAKDHPAAEAVPAPAAPVAAQSGFPGRPSSRSLVKAELQRRWAVGERYPSRKRGGGESAQQWSKVLSGWLATAHPNEPPMGVDAARAAVTSWLRELNPIQKPEVLEITGREVLENI